MLQRGVPENLFSTSFGDDKVVMEMGCLQDACVRNVISQEKMIRGKLQRAIQASNSSQALFPTCLGCGEHSGGSQFSIFQ